MKKTLLAFLFLCSINAHAQILLDDLEHEHSADEMGWSEILFPDACTKASSEQKQRVDQGNTKHDRFLQGCFQANQNSNWCQQLTRPNPDSKSIFSCTYGENQIHRLIHPDENTWKNAYQAVQLVRELEGKGISVAQIYNWWRPEPYNANVGGAPGRHPYGTSVDVRFSSMDDMERAFSQLCRWRAQGRLRALGYYGSTGLHFGVGDQTGNTWGKECTSFKSDMRSIKSE